MGSARAGLKQMPKCRQFPKQEINSFQSVCHFLPLHSCTSRVSELKGQACSRRTWHPTLGQKAVRGTLSERCALARHANSRQCQSEMPGELLRSASASIKLRFGGVFRDWIWSQVPDFFRARKVAFRRTAPDEPREKRTGLLDAIYPHCKTHAVGAPWHAASCIPTPGNSLAKEISCRL